MAWYHRIAPKQVTAHLLEEVLAEQAAFEQAHPVAFTSEQRVEAVLQRLELRAKGLRKRHEAAVRARLAEES